MKSMEHDVISFEKAYEIALASAATPKTERILFSDSLFRILAEDIASDSDVPGFDKSMMDGYAARRADIRNELTVIETIQAGSEPILRVGKNQCSKIMTGAKVPDGADIVVMVEDTVQTGESTIRVPGGSSRLNIAKQGEDVKAGECVINRGTAIKPAHIAVLALSGNVRPLVCSLPSMGIISTGSELVEPENKAPRAGIRNTNAYQLMAQVRRIGIEPVYYGIAKDTQAETRRLLEYSLSECDVTLMSGGVSMGDFDLVPHVMRSLGVTILFDRIAIKPGKPTTLGKRAEKIIFALPGNPVSVYVLFEVLVKPFLYASMGCIFSPENRSMELGESIKRMKTDRDEFMPVRFEGNNAIPVEYHGSAHIHALVKADGLVRIGAGIETLPKGTIIDVRPV